VHPDSADAPPARELEQPIDVALMGVDSAVRQESQKMKGSLSGDGMIGKFTIKDGKIDYAIRYVETARYKAEREARKDAPASAAS